MQFGKDKYYIRDAVATSTQFRDKLEDRRSQDDQMLTIMWKKYKTERKTESEEKKKSSDARRGVLWEPQAGKGFPRIWTLKLKTSKAYNGVKT